MLGAHPRENLGVETEANRGDGGPIGRSGWRHFAWATDLAGAGGIEPPYGGIKIRCLTAWLRPTGANLQPRPRPCGGGAPYRQSPAAATAPGAAPRAPAPHRRCARDTT